MKTVFSRFGLAFGIVGLCLSTQAASTVVRSIANNNTANPAITVTATPDSSVFAYAVEEDLPSGLTPANISQGGQWDTINRKVKWGPWFDNTARALAYTVSGPTGTYTVNGVGSFDGISVPTTGDSQVVIPPPAGNSTAVRSITGGTNISVTATPAATVSTYAVEEDLPGGLTAANISQGGQWDAANRKVKWGPWFDKNPRMVNYTASGPSGTYTASGVGSFDGVSVPATGDSQIVIPPPAGGASAVARTITGGTNVVVKASPATTVSAYAVEENLQSGLTPATISDSGQWDAANRKVKWGPWFDNLVRKVTYTVSGSPGTYTASGVGSFDGVSVPTTGDSQVVVPPPPNPSTVVRSISGSSITVVATPASVISAYAVEEMLPAGVTPSNINQSGVWDSVNNKVKWGPFFDNTPRTLAYTACGSGGISGVGSFDGASVATTGPTGLNTCADMVQYITFAQPPDRTFGNAPFSLTASASSGLPVLFSVVSGPARLSGNSTLILSGAGVVAVRASQPGDAGWLPATPVDHTFVVAKASLTAKADDKTKMQGTPNPPLTINYAGFVNGDSASVLDVLPTALTTATASSPVGTYPITLSGGSDNNYSFVLQSGTLTVTPGKSSATFAGVDDTTGGNWKGAYGADGYLLANGETNLPSYAGVSLSGAYSWTWTDSTTDPRSLQKPDGTDRRAACWYSSTSFTIQINQPAGQTNRVALYCLDWDTVIRQESVEIRDTASGVLLNSQAVADFHGGKYLVWQISGQVTITVTNVNGNAVVSGLFFGPPKPQGQAVFVGLDATTQGNWHGAYGSEGYLLANDQANPPGYAAVSFQGAYSWTWAASSASPAALEKADGSGRQAATWFAPTSFTVAVSQPPGHTSQLALYFLDWDTPDRSERVDILDPGTSQVLGSEIVSNFHSGTYLRWQVTGPVNIRITALTHNAVLSGLFFGAPQTWTITWESDGGSLAQWRMQGTNVAAHGGAPLAPANVDPGWQIVGTADFNGDGQADLLWEHTNGSLMVWYMNGGVRIGSAPPTPSKASDPAWRVVAVADLNGDGRADLVWEHRQGSIAVWFMNGTTATSYSFFTPAQVDPRWQIVGVADFNGDGKAELLWRKDDGQLAAWSLNGTAFVQNTFLTPSPSDPSWKIVGLRDVNGDGKTDLIWQSANGYLAVWFMNGLKMTSVAYLNPSQVDPSWHIRAVR